jgi:hypothetical protein
MTEIYFILFVPSRQKPAGGCPVVIYGAGARGTLLKAANFASINAAHGFATISINNVGSGFGLLTTLTITQISGTSVSFEWKGRGIDENGDGVIEAGEGASATHSEIIGARDSNLQVVADLMQLVRVIEAGMDWDGDGAPDLDASRIAYEGHSYGAGVGPMLVAVERAVTTAVFLSITGADLWRLAGLAVGSRNGIGGLLASRSPSLLTSPGIDCLDRLPLSPASACTEGLAVPTTDPPLLWNEDMPARDAPPLPLTVVGATAIQEWFDNRNWVRQTGAGVAYAQYIRRRPLPGRLPTPVIVAVAKGGQTVPNPSAWESVRAGELEDRVTFFRNDLAFAQDSRMPRNPHRFSWFVDPEAPGSPPLRVQVGRWAQTQAALFFGSLGAVTIDPDGAGLLFETPIQGSLPEGLHYIR